MQSCAPGPMDRLLVYAALYGSWWASNMKIKPLNAPFTPPFYHDVFTSSHAMSTMDRQHQLVSQFPLEEVSSGGDARGAFGQHSRRGLGVSFLSSLAPGPVHRLWYNRANVSLGEKDVSDRIKAVFFGTFPRDYSNGYRSQVQVVILAQDFVQFKIKIQPLWRCSMLWSTVSDPMVVVIYFDKL